MSDIDPKIIVSPLSQPFTDDGITVTVEIYRLENQSFWQLEVVDEDDTSIVWDDPFPSEEAAWQEFAICVQDVGLKRLLQAEDDDTTTVH